MAHRDDRHWHPHPSSGEEMMRRTSRGAAVAVGVIVAMIAVTAGSAEKKSDIKQLMGENFGGLQAILYALITGNYAAVPSQVDVIAQHATDLTEMVPANAAAQRDQFLTYAMNLRAHAQDLKTISQVLMQHEKEHAEPGPDSLRDALAAHYGGMVSMCVACHNRFRPQPVKAMK
jgi:cytochrome c556